ncbi:alpha/beta hydrolase family protein [Oribacterium sp. P6A1]|uniref:alpha/beta hydrolase family protein n=1 Tax=Oribacterium sp. P6A1 TaxID=1410612 RepID=UPI00055B5CC2|nr:alpha/beta hydrolase [Oribacterium sp. P6A1]
MEKYFDLNEQGFSIRCKVYFEKDIHNLKHIVLATYGFGGNKDNKAIEKFADRITTKYKGFGVVCFDWPCHGKDARNKLILDECLTYMDLVISHIKNEMGAEDIYNYSSSFGAYVTLRYLHDHENPFRKTAFRCPAIKMYDSMAAHVTEDDWNNLNKGKEILRGYDRKIKISLEFLQDLKNNDVSTYDYMDYADDIIMIHGTKDEMAPVSVAEEFSENNVIELIKVENADHPFSNPKYMDYAIQKIQEFFVPED